MLFFLQKHSRPSAHKASASPYKQHLFYIQTIESSFSTRHRSLLFSLVFVPHKQRQTPERKIFTSSSSRRMENSFLPLPGPCKRTRSTCFHGLFYPFISYASSWALPSHASIGTWSYISITLSHDLACLLFIELCTISPATPRSHQLLQFTVVLLSLLFLRVTRFGSQSFRNVFHRFIGC